MTVLCFCRVSSIFLENRAPFRRKSTISFSFCTGKLVLHTMGSNTYWGSTILIFRVCVWFDLTFKLKFIIQNHEKENLKNIKHINNFLSIKKNTWFPTTDPSFRVWDNYKQLQISYYSKASRYTASRSTDLGDARFLIGSQNTWDTRILAKSLEDTRFLIFW